MDTFLPSQQTGSVSARRCLEEITAELDARVSDQQVVPPSAMGVRRFSGRDRTTGLHCFGSMRQYDQPLNVAQLDYQRAIVARLGGLIWCEDSPLGGAGFVVLLPGLGQPRMAAIGGGGGGGGGF